MRPMRMRMNSADVIESTQSIAPSRSESARAARGRRRLGDESYHMIIMIISPIMIIGHKDIAIDDHECMHARARACAMHCACVHTHAIAQS